MAKAELKNVEVKTVTTQIVLTLTEEEASVLRSLVGNITYTSKYEAVRQITNQIYTALSPLVEPHKQTVNGLAEGEFISLGRR